MRAARPEEEPANPAKLAMMRAARPEEEPANPAKLAGRASARGGAASPS